MKLSFNRPRKKMGKLIISKKRNLYIKLNFQYWTL